MRDQTLNPSYAQQPGAPCCSIPARARSQLRHSVRGTGVAQRRELPLRAERLLCHSTSCLGAASALLLWVGDCVSGPPERRVRAR